MTYLAGVCIALIPHSQILSPRALRPQWKIPDIACTVQCTVKVVASRADCWPAMVEWVMFDVDLWDTDGLSDANFFSVPPLDA